MRKYLLAFVLLVTVAWAVNVKLYLKDGSFHVVREYKVEADRVRYYSTERSEWEEIPLDLVDLKKTQAEQADRQEKLEKDAKVISAEEKVERETPETDHADSADPGVYWLDAKETHTIKAAEATVHTDKKRSILAKMAPIPVVSGRGTLELQGAHSQNVFTDGEQEFFIQLSETERSGLRSSRPKAMCGS